MAKARHLRHAGRGDQRIMGTKRTVDALESTADGRSRSAAGKSTRNAGAKARKQARINSNNN